MIELVFADVFDDFVADLREERVRAGRLGPAKARDGQDVALAGRFQLIDRRLPNVAWRGEAGDKDHGASLAGDGDLEIRVRVRQRVEHRGRAAGDGEQQDGERDQQGRERFHGKGGLKRPGQSRFQARRPEHGMASRRFHQNSSCQFPGASVLSGVSAAMFFALPPLFAYYIHQLSPFIVRFGGNFGLHWYGFAYVMAFICGYALYHRLAAQGYGELPPEKVADFITLAAIFGVMLGGRLGWVLFYGLDKVRAHPLDAFKLWEGGMASHGGILGLVIFTWVYARWQKVSWPGIGDNLVVVAPIGLFFGRVANFINGELWGRVITSPHPPAWAMQFPKELDAQQPELVAPGVHAQPGGGGGAAGDAAAAAPFADLRGPPGRRGAVHLPVHRANTDARPGGDADGAVHDPVRDVADSWANNSASRMKALRSPGG